jgi:hypothetical protein
MPIPIQLELDEADRVELATALGIHLGSLRNELVHTDDRSYRQDVRGRIERLERILGRLAPAAGRSSP